MSKELSWKRIAMESFLRIKQMRDAYKQVLPIEQQDNDALVSVQDWVIEVERFADRPEMVENNKHMINRMIIEDRARIDRWKEEGRG